jgi:alpha-mannosidase
MTDLLLDQLARRIPEIIAASVRERQVLEAVWVYAVPGERNAAAMAPPPAPDDDGWQPIKRGERWGVYPGDDPDYEPPRVQWEVGMTGGSTHWLRTQFRVPDAWRGEAVYFHHHWEGQSLNQVEGIVYLGGSALTGIDFGHRSVALPGGVHEGELLVRCAVPFPRAFGWLELQLHNETIYRLGQTMRVLLDAARNLHLHAPERHDLLTLLNRTYGQLDLQGGYQAAGFAASAVVALGLLQQGLQELQPSSASPRQPTMLASGHGHLDVAWLWPLWRTRQKVAHTVANTLHLLERYGQYHFSMSQPQVFAYLKADDPALYERMAEAVRGGRFEPVGPMWVEPDCNIPSGESFIRQIAHGLGFFQREFPERYNEQTTHIAWLPDVFGFTAALPQILRGCGVSCFMTSKLSWNQNNRMPYETFRWQGIDGSAVLAYFITTTRAPVQRFTDRQPFTYGGMMQADEVLGAWNHYQQKGLNRDLLMLYGHSDGGGGPDRPMLEMAEVLRGVPGVPSVRQGRAEDFFRELYERVWHDERLPTWAGELYFEYHRGTYTSQAATKQANRLAELRYREAEWLNAWAVCAGGTNRQAVLDGGWEKILLNQFHDILPGSSIAAVYADSRADHAEIQRIACEVWEASIEWVRAQSIENQEPRTENPELPDATSEVLTVWNTLPWARRDVVRLAFGPDGEAPLVRDGEGNPLLTQVVEKDGERAVLAEVSVPSYGYTTVQKGTHVGTQHAASLHASPSAVENDAFRIAFDERGEIASLYDKHHDRELVLPGARLNQLVLYEDRPLEWDSWDIDPFYVEKPYPVQDIERWEVVEDGSLRTVILISRRFGSSRIEQRIALWHNMRRIDFATTVEWQERQSLLRALFPLNLNSERATCEIQFGALERSTTRNTSWDRARFEVCAQRWVDLSEGDYGVALLNTGKYGHSFAGSTIGLSLLKGGVFPDPEADKGTHQFTYSLLPHSGDWRAAQVVRRAYELNAPLRGEGVSRWQGKRVSPIATGVPSNSESSPSHRLTASFLHTPTEHIVVETVKVAANGDGIIVRLYEAHNQRGPVELSFERAVASAEETDMLERGSTALAVEGNSVRLSIRPYEVKTLRVRFG